ncbi:MAG: (Fe-S)-binding protein [Planctomycetes bacterium]|nr:(Fe-S)-binding protein [Planctomycetota bacterium]
MARCPADVYLARVRVALFITCLTDTFFPRVGEAVVRVLRHFGCTVEFPEEQTCCGQPAYNSGLHDDARAVARRLVGVFGGFPHIVSPSASCVAMVRDHLPGLFADEPSMRQAATELGSRTREFMVFLREVLKVDVAPRLKADGRCTYHYPCHARGTYDEPELAGLLRGPGLSVAPPAQRELCCGFGGAFAIDYPEISAAMLRDRLDDLHATGARTVICNEGGCTLNLAGGAHRRKLDLRFRHVAELLAESLGLMEPQP